MQHLVKRYASFPSISVVWNRAPSAGAFSLKKFLRKDRVPFSQSAFENNSCEEKHSLREQLLQLALTKYVPSVGWSALSLTLAAKELGYSPSVCNIVTQSREVVSLKKKAQRQNDEDLVEPMEEVNTFHSLEEALIIYYLDQCNSSLASHLSSMDSSGLRIPQKIRLACLQRLKLTAPYIDRYDEALSIAVSSPKAAFQSFNRLLQCADEIWHFAGDVSVDMNWYTKRMILAGVYASTELYWTQTEKGHGQEVPLQVTEFLDRRLADIAAFGKWRAKTENGISTWMSLVQSAIQPMKKE